MSAMQHMVSPEVPSSKQHEVAINSNGITTAVSLDNGLNTAHDGNNMEQNRIADALKVASLHSEILTDVSTLVTPAPALASSRYNRQMLIPTVSIGGQEQISRAKVLVIGLGGLGSPAALYLAGAGVGRLGLLDDDLVELTNLHRQVVHRESSVQQKLTKVESAFRGCRELNSEVELIKHELRLDVSTRVSANDALKLVDNYDIVLDCTDNPATRYLINDLCVLLGKTLVSGAAQRLEGQMLVLNYSIPNSHDRGPCYRCVFPVPPSPDMVKGCGEIGILGPVVGTIGTLMATEALRLIVKGEGELRKPTMLMYSAWPQDPRSMFRTIGLRGRRSDCIACGDAETIKMKGKIKINRESIVDGGLNYVAFCGVSEERILRADQRISAPDFLDILKKKNQMNGTLIVDVRETYEVEMGTKLNTGIRVPISSILRSEDPPDELISIGDGSKDRSIIFVCQRGNDSQVAASKLIEWRNKTRTGGTSGHHSEFAEKSCGPFIGDIRGGLTAVEHLLLEGQLKISHH